MLQKKVPGAAVTLEKGRTGSFEITLDGRLAYSKLATGDFPSDAEVDALT